MPLREPRIELDRIEINSLLGLSGTSTASLCQFVRTIPEGSHIKMTNGVFVYNRGEVELEDTERRKKDCFMMSIWSAPISQSGSICLFQQPVPVKLRLYM